MSNVAPPAPTDDIDTKMLKVARAIAIDLHPIQEIMRVYEIDGYTLDRWNRHPRFQAYLKSEAEAWASAENTAERIKLKAGMLMEEFLLKAHADLHDNRHALNQRVELVKVISKMAGVDGTRAPAAGQEAGGKFHLTINIGAGREATRLDAAIPMKLVNPAEDDGTDPEITLDY